MRFNRLAETPAQKPGFDFLEPQKGGKARRKSELPDPVKSPREDLVEQEGKLSEIQKEVREAKMRTRSAKTRLNLDRVDKSITTMGFSVESFQEEYPVLQAEAKKTGVLGIGGNKSAKFAGAAVEETRPTAKLIISHKIQEQVREWLRHDSLPEAMAKISELGEHAQHAALSSAVAYHMGFYSVSDMMNASSEARVQSFSRLLIARKESSEQEYGQFQKLVGHAKSLFPNELNTEAPAPEYWDSTPGVVNAHRIPLSDIHPNLGEGYIEIRGNAEYQEAVKAHLYTIASTDVGQKLLNTLGAFGTKDDQGDDYHGLKIQPPSLSTIVYQEGGRNFYSNSAGGRLINFDPKNRYVGKPDIMEQLMKPWSERDPSIGLFHEMVHSYVALKHKSLEKFEHNGKTLLVSDQGQGSAEPRITGIPYRSQDGEIFPFDDPEFNPISENSYRREFAALQGEKSYYLRPKYGGLKESKGFDDEGQVPIMDPHRFDY